MSRKLLSLSVAALCAFCLVPANVQAAPDIEVLPVAIDFADVEVGASRTMMVTIQNVGGHPLSVTAIALTSTSNFAFAITLAPLLPAHVDPGASETVEITFSPDSVGAASAQLKIWSDSPGEEEVSVDLTGEGVATSEPCVAIDEILRFLDDSVANGTLYGNGPGNSANGRLGALRNMIEAAGDLIEANKLDTACRQLMNAFERCDGLPRPPEFVAGEAAPVLAGMIAQLMADMGCE